MVVTNRYARKLVWAICFAIFCAMLVGVHSLLSQSKNRVVMYCNGKKYEVISFSDLFLFLIMTVFAAIRLNVGSDYYNYYMTFNKVNKDMKFTKEIAENFGGYRWLSYIIKQFTDYEYAIFLVVAIILYFYLFHLMKGEVEERSAALLCYMFLGFFANSLNIIKQCIAMMFVFCFYNSLRNKNYFKCCMFGFLAYLFHFTALVPMVVIIGLNIIKIKPTKKLYYLSIAGGLFLFLFLPQLIKIMVAFLPSASGYAIYVGWRRNNQIRLVLAVAGMSAIYTFILGYIVKYKDVIKKKNKDRYFEITLLIIGLCINIASIRIWVVQRIALYFYQFIILILPTMFEGLPSNKRKRMKQILYAAMFVYMIFSGIFLGENEYYSYNTIFSGDEPIYDVEFNKAFN